jgi:large subunit ribosomal protein L5
MNNLQNKYHKEVMPKLKAEFEIKNALALPYLEKIVINAGMAEALQNKEVLQKFKEQLAQISGQTPQITLAKKSISTFKLKAGDPIGLMVTLRGKRAWDFLEKLISVVTPRIRDFRGLEDGKFDSHGNYNLGFAEHTIFPGLDLSKVDKARGLVVSLVIRNSDKQKSKAMLELLGLPFKKGEN